MTKNANEIGAAGEHIVCADLLLSGHRATLSAASLSYDVIADIGGKLFRIAVKSTQKPKCRPGRPLSKKRYGFIIQRGKRISTGKTVRQDYTAEDCDLIAVVGLDIRRVAYFRQSECPKIIWLEADTPFGSAKFGKDQILIKGFDDYTLESAIS